MDILNELLATLPDGRVASVSIGLHWTAVVMDVHGELRCGLASTLQDDHHHGVPTVPQAGNLENLTGLALAALTQTEQPTLVSVGMAATQRLTTPAAWFLGRSQCGGCDCRARSGSIGGVDRTFPVYRTLAGKSGEIDGTGVKSPAGRFTRFHDRRYSADGQSGCHHGYDAA